MSVSISGDRMAIIARIAEDNGYMIELGAGVWVDLLSEEVVKKEHGKLRRISFRDRRKPPVARAQVRK